MSFAVSWGIWPALLERGRVIFFLLSRFLFFIRDSQIYNSFWFFVGLCFPLMCKYNLFFLCPFVDFLWVFWYLCSVVWSLWKYIRETSECSLQRSYMILNNLSRKVIFYKAILLRFRMNSFWTFKYCGF